MRASRRYTTVASCAAATASSGRPSSDILLPRLFSAIGEIGVISGRVGPCQPPPDILRASSAATTASSGRPRLDSGAEAVQRHGQVGFVGFWVGGPADAKIARLLDRRTVLRTGPAARI